MVMISIEKSLNADTFKNHASISREKIVCELDLTCAETEVNEMKHSLRAMLLAFPFEIDAKQ